MRRLTEINQMMSHRIGQGTPHNMGIKTEGILKSMGHEMKVNPPKVLAHTARKSGKARAEKQRKAILLSKARRAGARIPAKH